MTNAHESFSKASLLRYELMITAGDQSGVTVLSSHEPGVLRGAYKKSVKETGLSLETAMSDEGRAKLAALGFDLSSIDAAHPSSRDFAKLILWFVGRNLPGLEYEIKEKVCLTGSKKKPGAAIGCGLFGA